MFKGMCVLIAMLITVNPIFAMGFSLDALNQEEGQVGIDLAQTNKTYADGLIEGKMSASQYYSSMGWFNGGFLSGVLGGLIGTLVIWGMSTMADVEPPAADLKRIENYSSDYKLGFLQSYENEVESKRTRAAVGGSLLGTVFIVSLLLMSTYY